MTDAHGILLIDKPSGPTSHDMVARTRRALGTRRVGHAGTLDPMATGLLVLGVGRATRLLTHLVGVDKEYEATIRLGESTVTDDAEGESLGTAPADRVEAVTDERLGEAVSTLTGTLQQVPSSVSAIKVDGRRAYDRVRSGDEVRLDPREITVSSFDVLARRRVGSWVDVDVRVACSSGTYVRALARDLGAMLMVGGHLTALRRTRVGPFVVSSACDPEQIGDDDLLAPASAAGAILPTWPVTDDEARDLGHGKRLSTPRPDEIAAAVSPDGRLVAVVEVRGGVARVKTGFPAPHDASSGGGGR